ncbi:uncharacterized protein LOC143208068 [Lasioglossum baleicum]|uniref:uncharacterized protein LOC143208068 n=1 Tax=Lasioglossum baleicum TaxID=434251 RepID=UPI003FCECBCA
MIHRPECRGYKQWKLERAKKSKQNDKKEKKKKSKPKNVLDCFDEDNEPQPTKVSHRKCKKVRVRRKRPKKKTLYVLRHISLTELALKKIKPSMEARELLLNPRHMLCLKTSMPELDIAMMNSAKCLMMRQLKKCPRKRKRRTKKVKKTAKDGKSKQDEDDEAKSKETITTTSKKSTSSRSKVTTKKSKANGKKVEVDEDSEEDECKSICSFHSQICLLGIKLTAEDKKKIKQHQREAEDANAEEKSVAAD